MTKTYYRRNLPHIVPKGGMFFITARLTGILPPHLLKKWQAEKEEARQEVYKKLVSKKENTGPQNLAIAEERKRLLTNIQKRYFKQIDDCLDQAQYGPPWLKHEAAARTVMNKFHEYDEVYYNLIAYCIMSNHFHILIDTACQLSEQMLDSEYTPLSKIMQYIKGGSAFQANQVLERKGRFWQPESYDHLVRDEIEFYRIVRYVANNPVKAKLVEHWKEWQFSYVHADWVGILP